ncbi:Uncharacterised protein [Serratia liquefaciens]|nr:Uncharacterised protein [Serratia liquefaciens]
MQFILFGVVTISSVLLFAHMPMIFFLLYAVFGFAWVIA